MVLVNILLICSVRATSTIEVTHSHNLKFSTLLSGKGLFQILQYYTVSSYWNTLSLDLNTLATYETNMASLNMQTLSFLTIHMSWRDHIARHVFKTFQSCPALYMVKCIKAFLESYLLCHYFSHLGCIYLERLRDLLVCRCVQVLLSFVSYQNKVVWSTSQKQMNPCQFLGKYN